MTRIVALIAALMVTALISGCGRPEFDDKKVYQIIAKSAPRYIEVRGGTSENGASIQINDDMKTDTQKWLFVKDEHGFYQIISKASGKSLELAANTIHLANSTNSNEQKWILLQDRQGFYLIIARTTGQAFDLTGAALTAGTPVGAFWAHAADSQKWSIMEVK